MTHNGQFVVDDKIRVRNLTSNMQKFYAICRDVKCNRNAFNLEQVPKQKSKREIDRPFSLIQYSVALETFLSF